LVISPDGSWIFAKDPTEMELYGWCLKDPNPQPLKFEGPKNPIDQLVFSLDTRWMLCCYHSGELYGWDLNKKTVIPIKFTGPEDKMKLFFSTDGNWVFSVSRELYGWDLTPENPSPQGRKFTGPQTHENYWSCGKRLVSSGNIGKIYVWDLTVNNDDEKIEYKGPKDKAIKDIEVEGDILICVYEKAAIYLNLSDPIISERDLFTLRTWPPFVEPSLLHHKASIPPNQPKMLELSSDFSKPQLLSFPHQVTAFEFSNDGNILMVASAKALFCWIYKKEKEEYSLSWDNGDELVCYGTNLKDVKNIPEAIRQVMSQNGALVPEIEEEQLVQLSVRTDRQELKRQLAALKREKAAIKARIKETKQKLKSQSKSQSNGSNSDSD